VSSPELKIVVTPPLSSSRVGDFLEVRREASPGELLFYFRVDGIDEAGIRNISIITPEQFRSTQPSQITSPSNERLN